MNCKAQETCEVPLESSTRMGAQTWFRTICTSRPKVIQFHSCAAEVVLNGTGQTCV